MSIFLNTLGLESGRPDSSEEAVGAPSPLTLPPEVSVEQVAGGTAGKDRVVSA